MTGPREPVDRDLLTETIRLFGMAVEYKGQVFNPAEVVVHTNGVTELAKLQAAWTVLGRWQARSHRGREANRLYYEMLGALVSGSDQPVIGAEESLGSDPLTPAAAASIAAQAGFVVAESANAVLAVAACPCRMWTVADMRQSHAGTEHHLRCDGTGHHLDKPREVDIDEDGWCKCARHQQWKRDIQP